MRPASGYTRKIQAEVEKKYNKIHQAVVQVLPEGLRPYYVNWIAIVIVVLGILIIISGFFPIKDLFFSGKKTLSPLSRNEYIMQSSSPKNLDEAKIKQAVDDKCNTTNNFERSLWKTGSMRVISWDADTGEPDLYGAKQEEPYQSLMVYEIPCQLPLVATVSATIHSSSSIGIVFEFDGVLQVILGDGDLRSIRYKTDTLGSRKMGWRYVPDPTKGVPLTHWLPDGGKITVGTQVDWTISFHSNEEKIEAQVSLSYKSRNGQYKTNIFPWVLISVQSYNPVQNVGRFIRIGINDQLYKGTQSTIKFRHFSIRSGWSE